jgi:hypothetical protein
VGGRVSRPRQAARRWCSTPAINDLRGVFPPVLRPDLLLTDDGFAMTELDSVPGGIGLTAFLNRLYEGDGGNSRSSGAAT